MRVLVLLMLLPTAAFAHRGGDQIWDQLTDRPITELALSQPQVTPVVLAPKHGVQCLLPEVEGQNAVPAYTVTAHAICIGE
ncbi:hypothetical protein TM5383_02992 [Thalassovita mediterranea]|jgi:hypothetical protein|uniref:Uncharacterized protein n=2 Tax=Thalassovita mediterranea TaxID=340021 RepID=A0A0P1H5U8_9RHOB|nr:hypothetical protein [Thalassovita mediterranea]MCG7575136.1 hypothetical protein [Phaeobacter sp. CNT1-3]CUH85754.1 hypothetical protein TM5383_02992 [Thalassovita mediterranea]SIS29776.1 hypothetical protein SAMN05421685_10257 [Thalassovita mediterranea]